MALGGWGGYITFHFDHPIANIPGQRDFAVWGNAYQEQTNQVFGGMNEAGIVMVSKDTNGNGLPDDPWYEISGSCDVDSVGKVIYGYEVTYRRNPMGDIPWTDNQGNSGTIDRVDAWHTQEYYPLWLPDGLTFRGTRLPDNMIDLSENVDKSFSKWYYVLVGFRYGYVDNLPNFTDKADATSYNIEGCGIDISWAVNEQRQPVTLDHIDFVRVYTGLNQKCPAPNWWGETSTEIISAEDLHLEASLEAMNSHCGSRIFCKEFFIFFCDCFSHTGTSGSALAVAALISSTAAGARQTESKLSSTLAVAALQCCSSLKGIPIP